jgi:hypothetical protein
MPDVDVDKLAREIEIFIPLDVHHCHAMGMRNHHGRKCPLCGPRIKIEGAIKLFPSFG